MLDLSKYISKLRMKKLDVEKVATEIDIEEKMGFGQGKKILLMLLIFCLCAVIGFLVVHLNEDTSSKNEDLVLVPVILDAPLNPSVDSKGEENQKKPVQSLNSPEPKAKLNNKVDIASIYPFVDESLLIQSTNAPSSVPVNHRDSSLPAIPNYQPRPNLPDLPTGLPPIPNTIGNPTLPAIAANTVKGVFTAGDSNNIAILNNGKIVQEGENYNGTIISRISADGIHFENGNSIAFK